MDAVTGRPRRWLRMLLPGLAAWLLSACPHEPPLRIGLLADLSGRNARFNVSGRNGVVLAVEQVNQAGGIRGRRIELLVRDTGHAAGAEFTAARALLDAGVSMVIGPFSSPTAEKLLPLFDAAGVVLLCPTSTDAALAGRDDQLLRLNRTTQDSAAALALTLYARGHRRLAVATDMRNPRNNGGWRDAFVRDFTQLGGAVSADAEFGPKGGPSAYATVRGLLATAPDGLVFVANGVDAARLAQQVAKLGAALPMAAPDWAEDRSLVEIGGRAVEGLLLAAASRPAEPMARFAGFQLAYQQRFGVEPNYRAIAGYDAVTVLAKVLSAPRHAESWRDALLRQGPYVGLLQPIVFDRFGDATRRGEPMAVQDGRFVPLP